MPLTDAQAAEIAALRRQAATTARPTVPALEAMLLPRPSRSWITASSG